MSAAFPSTALPWAIDYAAVKLIAHFEQGPGGGVALKSYRCSAGVWTIGWGETDADKAQPGAICTPEQADQWLAEDVAFRAREVKALLKRPAGPKELGAMVSLAYNIGLGNFAKSSVLRAHNAGDTLAAARAFALWNKVKGRELAGLTRRRAAEAAMYLEDAPASREAMPQDVQPESRLFESPLVKLGATMAGGGGVVGIAAAPPAADPAPAAAAVAQAASAAAQVEQMSGSVAGAASAAREAAGAVAGLFGVSPQVALAIGLVAGGAAVIYWRLKQRRQGWV